MERPVLCANFAPYGKKQQQQKAPQPPDKNAKSGKQCTQRGEA